VSSGRKPKSVRAQRREAERREAAVVRGLEARARVLTYEAAELDQAVGQQPRLLDVALMSRYAARSRVFRGCRELLPPEGSLVLALIPAADAVLCKAGAGWSLAPDCWGRPTWPDMLRWGLDKAADTCRLLRVGLTYGAVVMARAQFERWTLNVAFHHNVTGIGDTESTADYVRRVWSVYPDVAESLDVGLAWSELSEWLHGRGLITAALGEIVDAADGAVPGEQPSGTSAGTVGGMLGVHQRVGALAEIVLRQVRGGVSLVAVEHYGHKFTPALQATLRPDTAVGDKLARFLPLLNALDFRAVFGGTGRDALLQAEIYRLFVGDSATADMLASGISPPLAASAMLERRGRAVNRARMAFKDEQEGLGSEFAPERLEVRLFRYIAVSEAAFLVAGWAGGREADALRTAAAALQSAWWLWLEDTDDAMSCVRGVLEQTSRARAHRVKPARAARVEDTGAASSPARWLEAAGWKRLAVLGRALGEFTHVSFRARWSGARGTLSAMQASGIPTADSTARGHALDAASCLLAHEVAVRLDQACPAVGAAFRARVTGLGIDEHERYVEELLQRSLDLRGTDFGQPDLRPLPTTALHVRLAPGWSSQCDGAALNSRASGCSA
jgi:hypothetical protein